MVPAMTLFSSWPCSLVRECYLAGRLWSSSSVPRISNSNTWPSSRPCLAAVVREISLTLDGFSGALWPPSFLATQMEAKVSYNHSCSFVPSSRIADESRVTPLAFFSSILEYFGVRRTASQSATRSSLRDSWLVRLLSVLFPQNWGWKAEFRNSYSKMEPGKQRLSNSYLKTESGKIAGAEVEQ